MCLRSVGNGTRHATLTTGFSLWSPFKDGMGAHTTESPPLTFTGMLGHMPLPALSMHTCTHLIKMQLKT